MSGLLSTGLDLRFGVVSFFCLLLGLQLYRYLYNAFVHPLRRFAGPNLASVSCLPKIFHALRGDEYLWLLELHRQYGEVVRVTPNELSFASADAWKDIYGHRKAGQPGLIKDPSFYTHPGEESRHLANAEGEVHARQRRIFAHAFSDRALKLQEPLFLTFVNKLIVSMRRSIMADPEHKFNMVNQYNYTTFDIMGDLTFGEPLDMLENGDYHPWVAAIFANFRFGTILHCIVYYPILLHTLKMFVPPSIREKQKLHKEFSHARVDRRLEKRDARPDIWGLVLEKEGSTLGLSKKEMYSNGNIFMIAGTETTATLLSGLTFHLLKNPAKMDRLTHEIRSAFATDEDITIERLQALRYLHACIEEGLRMYPPVTNGLPRIVPPGGAMIDGHEVPGGTQVYVSPFATYRNQRNFLHADSFIPERWLSESGEFTGDKKHALQPFSTGPRVCLGRNMAYHEIRLILSKLLWNFDLRLCAESSLWNEQNVFIMWDKGPLFCQVRQVQRQTT
ncbi:hypothetical protein M433DRAFT_76371 [Acidomyces richmondensis BFW]|nr:MAG: hypothetical protein FE78DRAFT_151142 [Acidomyces sp. 'richmondensis']KYG41184.1 hypothetical protein M433DRAFT_76371 [Acidomyces richmondensis BFW]